MRILFVDHTGAVSGAELSLVRLAAGLRADHSVAVACPAAGPLAGLVDAAGVRRFQVPAFEASLRLHPLHTTVGVARLAAAGLALARVCRRYGADVLHANSPRAGLMGAIARRLGGPPLVVHLRDDLPMTPVGRAVRFVLTYSADAVVAVSRYTARRFNDGLDRSVATHVYNGLDTDGLRPDPGAPASVREELGITADAALLGQVSQITPWKGQDTAIRALAELRRGGVDAHLLLVGEVRFAGKAVRYDNHEYLRSLHRLVTELGVDGAVHFLGQRDDVARILSAIDVSLLPSSHEPFGRVVLESMAVETPPLVSEAGAGPELVEDGVSGRLLPADRPELWAAAARELLDDPAARTRMGRSGREAVGRFTDDAQVRGILAVYERALGWREPAGANGSAREAEKPAEVAAWRG